MCATMSYAQFAFGLSTLCGPSWATSCPTTVRSTRDSAGATAECPSSLHRRGSFEQPPKRVLRHSRCRRPPTLRIAIPRQARASYTTIEQGRSTRRTIEHYAQRSSFSCHSSTTSGLDPGGTAPSIRSSSCETVRATVRSCCRPVAGLPPATLDSSRTTSSEATWSSRSAPECTSHGSARVSFLHTGASARCASSRKSGYWTRHTSSAMHKSGASRSSATGSVCARFTTVLSTRISWVSRLITSSGCLIGSARTRTAQCSRC